MELTTIIIKIKFFALILTEFEDAYDDYSTVRAYFCSSKSKNYKRLRNDHIWERGVQVSG